MVFVEEVSGPHTFEDTDLILLPTALHNKTPVHCPHIGGLTLFNAIQ
jgi:hypothetical protein